MGFRRLRTPFPLKGKKVFDLLRNYCSTFSGISVRGLADFLFEVGRNMQKSLRVILLTEQHPRCLLLLMQLCTPIVKMRDGHYDDARKRLFPSRLGSERSFFSFVHHRELDHKKRVPQKIQLPLQTANLVSVIAH